MAERYFICEHCGNIIAMVEDRGVPVMCCGQKMTELIAGTTDAAVEKHVPVVAVNGSKVTVTVGSVPHPMMDKHYIQWISVETNQGVQRKKLTPESEPKAEFALAEGETVEAVYAYCNLHGLWKAD